MNLVKRMADAFGDLINLFPTTSPRKPKTQEQINEEANQALARDWEAIGGDMRAVMRDIDSFVAHRKRHPFLSSVNLDSI